MAEADLGTPAFNKRSVERTLAVHATREQSDAKIVQKPVQ